MSFFFQEHKAKPAKRQVPAQAGKASKETLNRLGCRGCPLDKCNNLHPKMAPDLCNETDIYFLGEGPDDVEDEKGMPFVGKAGKLLKSILGTTDGYSFDNVIRDFSDPSARNPSPAWIAMECCRGLVAKSIEQAKPKLIVGLGILPLQWMLNSSDMVGLRGRVFAVKVGNHPCWFMPTYHPQFIIDNAYQGSEPLRSKLGHCLKFDVARAVKLAQSLKPPKIDTLQGARAGVQAFNGQSRTQLAPLLKLISEARKAPVKAIDIETSHLRPYAKDAKILTVAISFEDTNFAFAMDHPKAQWAEIDKGAIKLALTSLLIDETTIVAHNAPFEIEWLVKLLGREAIYHDNWECTMMQAHFIDERRGKRGGNDDQFQPNPYQALDFLVKLYFGLSYKGLFKLDRKNMSKADLDETLLYNGADTKYTLRLYWLQTERLHQAKLYEAYREAKPRQSAVALMQSLGIDIDQAQNKAMQEKLGGEVAVIEQRIKTYKEVKDYINKFRYFNPASNPDVIRIFKEYLKVGKALINAEGKESVDKSTLGKIKHPLAKDIEELRNRAKLKSTYVDPFEYGKGALIWPDKKIHPAFNTTFAETGRTSCTAYWTPILTQRGEIPICDVVVGDRVWTHKNRWKPVTKLWRKGWEVMLNLKLSNGSILTCTKNHLLLNANNQWITAGQIYGLFKEMDKQPPESMFGFGNVPQQKNAFSERNSSVSGNNRIQCLVGDQELSSGGRVEGAKAAPLFNVQDWGQKPNEGLDRGKVSTVERCCRRRSWIQNHIAQGETDTLPPPCSYVGSRATSDSPGMGSSSHRHKSTQQRSRQFSTDYSEGSPGYPLASTSGFEVTSIEEIEIGRSCEVFDITVADDASYLTCGVISHNSDEPNQQNWPSRNDKWVRKQIVAPEGHVLVAFDYGQLEACTAAMCTKDKVLVKALWEDYDIHMEWAQKVAKRYPRIAEGMEMKKLRSIVKNKLVFPAMFGASNNSVAGYLNMPIEPINKLMDEFWQTFSGLYNWQKRLMNDYYDTGFVCSPTGRRRHYPLTKNQAINYPIQSVACDIVCRGMVSLSVNAVDSGKWYLHPIMNIHDDLTMCVPDDPRILEESIETIYKTMLAPAYDFINVPLSVSCSIGTNWYDMEDVGKFWSHKDL